MRVVASATFACLLGVAQANLVSDLCVDRSAVMLIIAAVGI